MSHLLGSKANAEKKGWSAHLLFKKLKVFNIANGWQPVSVYRIMWRA